MAALIFWCLNSSGVNFDSMSADPARIAGALIAGLGGARLLNQYADTTLRKNNRDLEAVNRGLSGVNQGLAAELSNLGAVQEGSEGQNNADSGAAGKAEGH